MESSVPVIDLAPWFSGDRSAQADVAAEVDRALQSVGFFLITGHGVTADLRADVRAQARGFFALPRQTKRYIQARERRAQFMRNVIQQTRLRLNQGLQTGSHRVEIAN